MSGRGIVEAEIFRSELIEANARTSDPTNPAVGDFWIRSDVQPSVSGATTVAALRIQGPGGVLEVPLFDSSEASNLGADVYVGERRRFDDGTVGFIAETDQGGSLGSPRLLAPDGTEYQAHDALEVNAIPDSAVFQVNAQNLTGFNDGDTVSTWPDQVAGIDATATGSPEFRTSAINGYPAIQGDGTDDKFDAPIGTYSQPYTIFTVQEIQSPGENQMIASSDNTSNPQFSGDWRFFAGSRVDGSTDSSIQLIGLIVDGSNSEINENGTQTGAGDVGTNDLADLGILYRRGIDDLHTDAEVGFVEVHNGLPSDGYATREQEIADMWGITI